MAPDCQAMDTYDEAEKHLDNGDLQLAVRPGPQLSPRLLGHSKRPSLQAVLLFSFLFLGGGLVGVGGCLSLVSHFLFSVFCWGGVPLRQGCCLLFWGWVEQQVGVGGLWFPTREIEACSFFSFCAGGGSLVSLQKQLQSR